MIATLVLILNIAQGRLLLKVTPMDLGVGCRALEVVLRAPSFLPLGEGLPAQHGFWLMKEA